MQRTYTEIDDELLEAVRRRAAEQGRAERDVIEEAIRRYLDTAPATSPIETLKQEQANRETRRFVALLDRMGSRFDLDEDEAVDLANAELHAMREEHRAEREGEQL